MKQAIHFGAGNIGRGFIGALLHASDYHVCFVDVVDTVINFLSTQGEYRVKIVGENEKVKAINNVDGLLSNSEHLPQGIATADLISCAVGPNILEKIAMPIATGLQARKNTGNTQTLYIIACENMLRASSALKKMVYSHADKELSDYMDNHVKFLDSAVDRIVPASEPDEHLSVTVEEYYEWCVEAEKEDARALAIDGIHRVDVLEPYIERKLFTLNSAHAFLAWLGYHYKIEKIDECMEDERIVKHVKALCAETAKVLIRKHGFDTHTHQEYIDSIILRFRNKYLQDSIYRIGRAPLRKLSEKERFVSPMKMAIEYGFVYDEMLLACACGLHFVDESDKESIEIQQKLKIRSADAVFEEISGVSNTDIKKKIMHMYHNIDMYL